MENQLSTAIGPHQLQRLLEISTQLSSTLDLNRLLQMVIDLSTELTDTEVASILLVDERTGELRFVASSNSGVGVEDVVVPLEGSLAGWIVLNGKPLVSTDVKADNRHFQGVDDSTKFVTRTLLGVPLISRNKVIGCLEVLNKKGSDDYTDQDIFLTEALASQAAVAIENARLFQQSDLIAEVMHELKTPLMALSVSSELLTRDTLPETERGVLIDMIKRESNRLVKLTQDYLDLARLESRRVTMAADPVDMLQLTQQVINIAQPQAEQRNIEIQLISPNKVPAVSGDFDRLKQVMLNLVSNAIKYNRDDGQIVIRLDIDKENLKLQVRDSGRGIEEEHLNKLFSRFYRIPDAEGYSEGTGLGLSIAKTIVEEHSGRIDVSSQYGVGTSFTVTLPISTD
ncbi:MAG: GAF domain-containing sensor histidine kinase [Anaerolineales bacterium]|nr:GAF domain-containing sensor histidine kinase [Anaerolineales bacterium]